MKIYRWIWASLAFALIVRFCPAQASPYNLYVVTPQSFTATAQCGAVIQTNGLAQAGSTIGSSYTSGSVTLSGTGLTTASFQVLGSFDNGATFYQLLLNPVASPSSTSTTITATANGAYQFPLPSVSQIKICTTGTFTAASITMTVTLTPNGLVSRTTGGGGGGPPTGFAGGDLGGSYPDPSVVAINGVAVAGSAASPLVIVGIDSTHSAWRQLTADDIAPGFSINSFTTGASNPVEIGTTISNPTFSSSYSATPTSANITNTDSINSPFNLTTPFTSATIVGNFQHTSQASTTFTLTAVGPVTKTTSLAINWLPRVFGGVGTAGATGATASGSNAVLTGATGTLSNNGLGQQNTWGSYSPSSQYIYVLAVGSSCTFTSGGFSFLMNSPVSFTFTNQNGSAVPMYLYRSVNSQNAPTTLIGTC